MWQPQKVQFVVKLTKLCNLRCRYCYEYPYLGNPAKMELPAIESMLRHIGDSLRDHGVEQCEFILHGGEPFLLPAEYFRALYAKQRAILGESGIDFQNVVQSNLTCLQDEHIALLRDGVIASVGVSIDLFGNERVNVSGKSLDERTLDNMDRLSGAGIRFGAISVLSRKTAPYAGDMYRFFSACHTDWRLLPIDLVGYEGQHENNVLTAGELCTTFQKLFAAWLRSENPVKLEPLNEYMDAAISAINAHSRTHKFDKATEDSLFIINTNGDVYAEADAYDERHSFGNVFTTSFTQLLASPARMRAVERAAFITGSVCAQCEHYGHCNGFRMAEATTEKLYWNKDGNITCAVIKPMIDHIKRRFVEEGVVERYEENRKEKTERNPAAF